MNKYENQFSEKIKGPTVQTLIDTVKNKLPQSFIEPLIDCKNVGEAIGALISMLYDPANNLNPEFIKEIEELLRQKRILD